MINIGKSDRRSVILNVVIWGSLWGIFESTAGYLLHAVSFGFSFIIWYPAACFFLANALRSTGRISSVFFVGLLSSSVKMLNLLLPGRIDKVINPAVSIVLESLAMAAVIFTVNRLFSGKRKNVFVKLLAAAAMNTAWRTLYILYIAFLVPAWMRDISVISSAEKFIPFFITQNLFTSMIIFAGYVFKPYIMKPINHAERRISERLAPILRRSAPFARAGLALTMLGADITLQILLK